MPRLNSHMHPHYHLRPNKAIDRLLFVDIIRAFDGVFGIQKNKYVYVGLGGPYIEDFKLLSNLFPKLKMISLEHQAEVYKRQLFHKCSRNLTLEPKSFGEFLNDTYMFEENPTIVWLDYTDLAIENFKEIESLCLKIQANSLIRITLKSHTKCEKDDFQRIYDDYLSGQISEDDITFNNISNIVCNMLKNAINKALCSANLSFLPLHQARYSDSTQMFSLTGVICDEETDHKKLFKKIHKRCSDINGDNCIDVIDIPSLTLKERMHLESCLPRANNDGKVVARKLKYMIEKRVGDNLLKCQQYEKYYRYYPHFNKIIP